VTFTPSRETGGVQDPSAQSAKLPESRCPRYTSARIAFETRSAGVYPAAKALSKPLIFQASVTIYLLEVFHGNYIREGSSVPQKLAESMEGFLHVVLLENIGIET